MKSHGNAGTKRARPKHTVKVAQTPVETPDAELSSKAKPKTRARKKPTCWKESVGERGYQVTVYERAPGGNLWMRWWVPKTPTTKARFAYQALEHRDRAVALELAKQIAGGLLASQLNGQTGRTSVAELLAAYKADVVPSMKGSGPKEAARRIAMWLTFLGPLRFVDTIDKALLDDFVKRRLGGEIKLPPPFKLKSAVTKRTPGADLEFLRAAIRHVMTKRRPNGKLMLTENPMAGYPIPENRSKQRPVTTYDRFLALRKAARAIDQQRLLEHLLTLLEALGWRISAICALRGKHVDLRRTTLEPHGRIHKDPIFDKEGTGGWIPLSKSARRALEILTRKGAIAAEQPLFPAPLARDESGQEVSWSRHHARDLFDRAEKHAGLEPLPGGDFHPFRRKWATERKHLPVQDVAKAGAWLDIETLQDAYQLSDPETLLAVMTEPRKLRDSGIAKRGARKGKPARASRPTKKARRARR